MKLTNFPKILFFFLTLSSPFLCQAEEILGLDSLDFKNQATIRIVEYNANTKEWDTSSSELIMYKSENLENLDFLLSSSESPNDYKIFSNDTINYLNIEKNQYRQGRFEALKWRGEVIVFYYYLNQRRDMDKVFLRDNKESELTSVLKVNPEAGTIHFSSEYIRPEDESVSKTEIIISSKNYDSLHYKSQSWQYEQLYIQLSADYIFTKEIDSEKKKKLDEIYYNWKSDKYKLMPLVSAKPRPVSELVGKVLKTDLKFEGLNRDTFNLKEQLAENGYSVLYTWGSWCGPCLENRDNLKEFVTKSDIPLYTIMYEYDKYPEKKMKKYMEVNKPIYDVYRSDNFINDNKLTNFPKFMVVDSEGKIVEAYDGLAPNPETYLKLVSKYSAKK